MGVTSYPTLITTVSDDIDKVGGKNATLGMIREDHQGRKYVLLKAAGTIDAGTVVANNSGPKEAITGYVSILGVNTTGKQIGTANGLYFWCQTYGPATVNASGAISQWASVTGGTGGAATANVNSDGYKVGYALAAASGGTVDIFVEPYGSFYVLTTAAQQGLCNAWEAIP